MFLVYIKSYVIIQFLVHFRFLEPVHFREDEDLETCISHLETAISSELGVQLTPFTAKDKVNEDSFSS